MSYQTFLEKIFGGFNIILNFLSSTLNLLMSNHIFMTIIFSIMIYFIINLIVNIIKTIIKMVSIKNGKGKNDVE